MFYLFSEISEWIDFLIYFKYNLPKIKVSINNKGLNPQITIESLYKEV